MTYPQVKLYIDGRWIAGTEAGTLPIIDPATGEQIGTLPVAGAAELDAAQLAAQRGFEVWSGMLALDRFKLMTKATALLRDRAPKIARVLTLD